MAKDEAKVPLPPYVSFKTFRGFIQKLHELNVVPDQIDTSVLRSYAGSVGRQIVSTLKYLKLIEPSGKTNQRLRELVNAYGSTEAWQDKLTEVVFDAFAPITDGLDLDAATSRQLEDKFKQAGADGEVLQKCMAFFTAAVAETGSTMSPHITNRPRKRSERSNSKKKAKKPKAEENDEEVVHLPLTGSAVVKFSVPIPDKGTANIFIPRDVEQADWDMISTMMSAYISRLGKRKD